MEEIKWCYLELQAELVEHGGEAGQPQLARGAAGEGGGEGSEEGRRSRRREEVRGRGALRRREEVRGSSHLLVL